MSKERPFNRVEFSEPRAPFAPPPNPDDFEVSLGDLGESELNFHDDEFRDDGSDFEDTDEFEDSDIFY